MLFSVSGVNFENVVWLIQLSLFKFEAPFYFSTSYPFANEIIAYICMFVSDLSISI